MKSLMIQGDVKPRYDKRVAKWLYRMIGDYELFKVWLMSSTKLATVTILKLDGYHGVGKTLLARGIRELFKEGAVVVEDETSRDSTPRGATLVRIWCREGGADALRDLGGADAINREGERWIAPYLGDYVSDKVLANHLLYIMEN